MSRSVLVTGAGGFIGHHLVSHLKDRRYEVRGVNLKAPAALCRKVAEAADGGTITVWGDGEQTRSFMYVDDCVEGIHRLMRSDWHEPLNLGTDRMVTINELVDIIAEAAGKEIGREHDLSKPQGVRGRNSDNTRLREVLGWEPGIDLEEGMAETYRWIERRLITVERQAV